MVPSAMKLGKAVTKLPSRKPSCEPQKDFPQTPRGGRGKRKHENSSILPERELIKIKRDEISDIKESTELDLTSTQDRSTWPEYILGKQIVEERVLQDPAPAKTVGSGSQSDPLLLDGGGESERVDCTSLKKVTQSVVDKPAAWPSCCSPESPCPKIWNADRSLVKKKKYYGVRRGRKVGIFQEWFGLNGAEEQVNGFHGATFKSFKSAEAVENYMNNPLTGCFHSRRKASPVSSYDQQDMHVTGDLVNEEYNICIGCAALLDDECKGNLCVECTSIDSRGEVLDSSEMSFNLCPEQEGILRLVIRGHNVFFTGAAGTGKSAVLKAIICHLRKQEKKAQILAPTGIAALLLGGTTIHTYAGWNIRTGRDLPIAEMEINAHQKRTWKRLVQCTDVLIIDEISMVENFTFARLDRVMRSARYTEEPFGGAHVIVTGDFYQLPPVRPFKTCFVCGQQLQGWRERLLRYTCSEHGEWHDCDKWAFCSDTWSDCGFVCRQLERVHRQTDSTFVALLSKLRQGVELTHEEEMLLISRDTDFDSRKAVKIYPHCSKVAAVNSDELEQLKPLRKRYLCVDNFQWLEKEHPELEGRFGRVNVGDQESPLLAFSQERHRFSDELTLKEGMPVLLLINLSFNLGLVNGSRGQIIGFEDSNESKLSRAPLNKKNNSTINTAIGDNATYKEKQIRDFSSRAETKLQGLPIVRFENGVERTIYPNCSITELGNGPPLSLMSRTQIPLIAGWAITVHKSQGMTIARAVVDMDRAWEYGQSYVAMSRVKGLDGLVVHGLARGNAMRADETVKSFMAETFSSC
jgi:ATP-dependent DNA helicase PIF1